MDTPCHHCDARTEGCHAACERYAEFKRLLERRRSDDGGAEEFLVRQHQERQRRWNLRRRKG